MANTEFKDGSNASYASRSIVSSVDEIDKAIDEIDKTIDDSELKDSLNVEFLDEESYLDLDIDTGTDDSEKEKWIKEWCLLYWDNRIEWLEELKNKAAMDAAVEQKLLNDECDLSELENDLFYESLQ